MSRERAPRKPGRGGAVKKAMSQEEAAAVMQKLVRRKFSDHSIQRIKSWRRRKQQTQQFFEVHVSGGIALAADLITHMLNMYLGN